MPLSAERKNCKPGVSSSQNMVSMLLRRMGNILFLSIVKSSTLHCIRKVEKYCYKKELYSE